jgi:diaminohydroxyphosphoribosylaminopyrimidine deaminase/5-amino-6-(5-phosphoribosylamino)uracil reductase
MKLALQQALKTLGNTGSNPAVGCVITKKNYVVGAGFTSKSGRPHAEYNAIHFCKSNLKNSDLYVTLEPCSHYGKTPPCVNIIAKKKIKKVYFSIKDPDPRSYNKSKKKFKKNKIQTRNGILSSEIKNFYASYIKTKKNELPFVTAKMAISKDFYTNNIKNRWITNNYSRGRVHLMRSNHDCILTSVQTVIADNSNLTCRVKGLEKNSPLRIILDKNLHIPINSNIIKSSHKNIFKHQS